MIRLLSFTALFAVVASLAACEVRTNDPPHHPGWNDPHGPHGPPPGPPPGDHHDDHHDDDHHDDDHHDDHH